MSARVVAALIFAGTIVTRVPFATTHLYAWDSTLYARALEQGFHVTADPSTESPHPPGYIWYVAAAALVRLVVRDSNAALVIVSIVASALAGAAFYLIARRLVRERVALTAALAFVLSPVVWMYSEVAYPYTVLALLSLTLGWWLVDGRRPIAFSAVLGVLLGFRQDLLLILGLLWLWRIAGLGLRRAALAAGALLAASLTWAIPTVALSGGPGDYLRALTEQSAMVAAGSAPAAGTSAIAYFLVLAGEPLVWGLLPLGLILVADGAWLAVRAARGRASAPPRGLALALVLWTAPAMAFYVLVHIGEWGYVLSVIPPLLLAAATRADRAVARVRSAAWPALAAVVVLVPALAFLFVEMRFSAERLRQRERELSSIVLVHPSAEWADAAPRSRTIDL
jgi:hypothetical protein